MEINDLWGATQQQTQPSYSFSSGSFDDYQALAKDIGVQKQQYDDTQANPQGFLNQFQNGAYPQMTDGKVNTMMRSNTANFLVNNIDRLASVGLSFIAMDDDGEYDFSADEEEKAEIREYLEACFPDPSRNIPPWIAALIAILLIYGLKAKDAFALRKAKKKIEAQEKQLSETAQENEQLKKQLEEEKAKRIEDAKILEQETYNFSE